MPIRLVDGDKIATSTKLRRCSVEARAWYSYLLTYALANGSFECDTAAIHARYFAVLMPEMSVADVASFIAEYERHGLLLCWTERGKRWGYWTLIERRLPNRSKLAGNHYAIGRPVPAKKLARYMGLAYREVLHELAECIGEPYLSEEAMCAHGADNVHVGLDRIGGGRVRTPKTKDGGQRGVSAPLSSSSSSGSATLRPPTPHPPAGRNAKKNNAQDSTKKNESEMRFGDAPELLEA